MWDMVWNLAAVLLAVFAVWEFTQAVRGPAPTSSPWASADKGMLLLCLAMVLHLGDRQSPGRLYIRYAVIAAVLGPLLVNHLRWKLSRRAPLPDRTPAAAGEP